MAKDMENVGKLLWENPSEKNWKTLASSLKKGGIVYYRVFFEKGKLNKTQDLRRSYAGLYDKKENLVAKIPIFKREGKRIEGATIYLKGLLILNS